MKVNELQAKQGKVDIVLDIVEKSEPKTFQKWGKEGSVCNAKGKDDTGEITVTLWNDQIDKVNVGSKIEIKNGYVGEWQGEKQLSTGKFGTLEVIGEGEAPAEAPEQPAEEAPAEEAPAETPEEPVEEEKVE
jgi:replication factor A1